MRRDHVPAHAQRVCQRLRHAGHEAYVVGGCVRDTLLGKSPEDWDVATSAHPEQVLAAFKKTIPTGIQHGTVTVIDAGAHVEVTTFRGEGAYSDARRPDHVVFGVSLEEDMSRRDFTVNAMAFDPVDERLIDPFGGAADLAARTIRAVGDPAARFREDGLRVMRAVRFAATLEFELEPKTLAAIGGALSSLARVSVERVLAELLKLMVARQPSRALGPIAETGIGRTILPELGAQAPASWARASRAVDAAPADAHLRLGLWLLALGAGPPTVDAIARRLKLANKDRARLRALAEDVGLTYAPAASDADLRRLIIRVGAGTLGDVVAARAALAVSDGHDPASALADLPARLDRIMAAAPALSITDLAVSGDDVIRALGVPPGRIVGDVLKALLERVVDDPTLNQRDALLALVPELGRASSSASASASASASSSAASSAAASAASSSSAAAAADRGGRR
jgi:tRNA nucleotidyltransferase (CCA-adding enzyme)